MAKLCEFGREIKKRLVDIDKNQTWLIEQVVADTGLYFDTSYMYKILIGSLKTPSVVSSIKKILGMEVEE